MKRSISALALGATLLLSPFSLMPAAAADDFPDQDVRLIIPFGPGGATDVIFRLVSRQAEQSLGQSIVPVNMAGAGATLGSREVKNAKPDGYTLLGSHQSIQLSYLAGMADYSYDAFEPMALLTQTINIPSTNSDHEVQTAADIAAYVEANPGEVRVGMIPSSTDHFFWVQFFEAAGIPMQDVRMISYPDTGSQVSALLANEIDFTLLNMPSGASFYEDGAFRPLGVAGEERLAALPEVATLREQNIDLVNTTARGVFAPKETPKENIEVIASAYEQALQEKEVANRIEKEFGSVVSYMGPEAYAAYLEENSTALERVAGNIDFSR
ncbi:tripartite tricarboxylate transporter substrate binding protein [Salinicola corii]|uniref:Tripartite tricarboxylate transporter substrate binding protein n=1 Tax=Salinicola corii TaxID=2606937 RepID=A0A640WCE4_9GAMM|nr:tripartite tricarboxylate transporter substrate binding protein [Salinicola corii]KAA0017469.1 tripartite tricarboxylate transporter substrate binding protein [Salinicola corii]